MFCRMMLFSLYFAIAYAALMCYDDMVFKKGQQRHSGAEKPVACSEDCRFCVKWSGEYDNNATVAWNCGCGQWMVNCDKKGKGTKKVQNGKKERKIKYWCCEGDRCNSAHQHDFTLRFASLALVFYWANA